MGLINLEAINLTPEPVLTANRERQDGGMDSQREATTGNEVAFPPVTSVVKPPSTSEVKPQAKGGFTSEFTSEVKEPQREEFTSEVQRSQHVDLFELSSLKENLFWRPVKFVRKKHYPKVVPDGCAWKQDGGGFTLSRQRPTKYLGYFRRDVISTLEKKYGRKTKRTRKDRSRRTT